MPFTEEEKKDIVQMVVDAIELDRARWRERSVEREKQKEAAKVTALYLVTFAGHAIAMPGEHGRAMLSQCIYARATVNPSEPGLFGGTVMQAIADGDGRRFSEPRNLILTGSQIASMVEVPESMLDT